MGALPLSLEEMVTRREFLKFGGAILGGLFLPPLSFHTQEPAEPLGRVLEPTIQIYDRPSLSARAVKSLWRDLVVPISEVTIGDGVPAYNRVWYRIGEDGFAHSGAIQPVEIRTNPVPSEIPNGGQLAELTVPFTDARWKPAKSEAVAYRLYYGTTHWVTGLSTNQEGEAWYAILDDKWKYTYYAPAVHFHLITPDEVSSLSPQVPLEAKRIEVRLPEQMLIAYEWDKPVFMTRTATGARFSSGNYETPNGVHRINWKRPYRHMAAGDRAAPNSYDLPGVPWVCYFTADGISIHGTYWHNDFGKPRSHGCINLSISAARWVYRWTLPSVPFYNQFVFENDGTRMDIIG